ncbi:MAG: alpha/beta fold hydrolase [Candidatus Sericytochromatia bacterium]|nr:alpha/beta fold hydrolase [Candidatus Sericytochromatia bacterium]
MSLPPALSEGFRPLLAHPDVQTFLSELGPRRPRPRSWRQGCTRVEVPLADGDHLLAWLHLLPDVGPADAPLVVHFHGLGSHADTGTLRGLSAKAHAAGLHSLRVNWRGAGGSERLCSRVTAGLAWPDVADVVTHAQRLGHTRIYLTGLSLGGAIVLNALARCTPRLPVAGAVCISPPMDFGAAGRSLATPRNRFYDARFVWLLARAVRHQVRHGKAGERLRPYVARLRGLRSVRAFDDAVTAPALGLPDVDTYHAAASPGPHLAAITTPTWVLTAADDPFIPVAGQRPPLEALPAGGAVAWTITPHGGHVGFFGHRPQPAHPWEDGHWAENAAIRWILAREAQA